MMKKIKIAQIGVTHEHAVGKFTSLTRLQDVFEIVGFVDDREMVHTPIFPPKDYPPESYPKLTLEQVLEDKTIEAVTVEVPNNELVPMAMKCMERGLAMHMDKPAGEDLALYKKLLDGCEAKNLPFQVGYMYRNNPAMLFVRDAVQKGWLGNIAEVQADMIHDYGGEVYQRYLSGFNGGIMYNLGCHYLDYFVRLLGVPDKVTSFLKCGANSANNGKNLALAVLEYPHTIATVRAYDQMPGHTRRFRIGGNMGLIEWAPTERFDGKPLEVYMHLREGNEQYSAGSHTIQFGPVEDRYEDQLLELARIIRGEITNPYTRQHDYDVHRVILAASGLIQW